MRLVPRRHPQGQARPRLREVPPHDRRLQTVAHAVRSRGRTVSAHGRASRCRVREVPRRPRLSRPRLQRLHAVPQGLAPPDDGPNLLLLPRHGAMGGGGARLRPREGRLRRWPARTRTWRARSATRPASAARSRTTGAQRATRTRIAKASERIAARVTPNQVSGRRGSTTRRARGSPWHDRHDGLECRKCHTSLSTPDVPLALKVLDFRGASRDCGSCHKDTHKGEFGRYCESCHRATTFKTKGFTHSRAPEFFSGSHQGLTCAKCHVRPSDPRVPEVRARTGARDAQPPRQRPAAAATRTCISGRSARRAIAATRSTRPSSSRPASHTTPARFHSPASTRQRRARSVIRLKRRRSHRAPARPRGCGPFRPSARRVTRTCTWARWTARARGATPQPRSRWRASTTSDWTTCSAWRRTRGFPCRSCHKTETGTVPDGLGHGDADEGGQDVSRLPPVRPESGAQWKTAIRDRASRAGMRREWAFGAGRPPASESDERVPRFPGRSACGRHPARLARARAPRCRKSGQREDAFPACGAARERCARPAGDRTRPLVSARNRQSARTAAPVCSPARRRRFAAGAGPRQFRPAAASDRGAPRVRQPTSAFRPPP